MKRAIVIEKRVAGIISWLERLKQSYSAGALESALMDAECAKADLENLRQDVWSKVAPVSVKTNEKKFLPFFMNFSRVAFLAVVVVLMAVVPIAKDSKLPGPIAKNNNDELVLAQPILIVREPKPSNTAKTQRKQNTAKPQSNKKANVSISAKPEKPKQEKAVAYDKVVSLVQTGRKALKNDSSVIMLD